MEILIFGAVSTVILPLVLLWAASVRDPRPLVPSSVSLLVLPGPACMVRFPWRLVWSRPGPNPVRFSKWAWFGSSPVGACCSRSISFRQNRFREGSPPTTRRITASSPVPGMRIPGFSPRSRRRRLSAGHGASGSRWPRDGSRVVGRLPCGGGFAVVFVHPRTLPPRPRWLSFATFVGSALWQRPPRILHAHAEIYASAAVVGSSVYVGSRALGLSPRAYEIALGCSSGGERGEEEEEAEASVVSRGRVWRRRRVGGSSRSRASDRFRFGSAVCLDGP